MNGCVYSVLFLSLANILQAIDIKISLNFEDFMQLVKGLTNSQTKLKDYPSEVERRSKPNILNFNNPYHPEDDFARQDHRIDDSDDEYNIKKVNARIENKLEKENNNFIAGPAMVASDDELTDMKNEAKNGTNQTFLTVKPKYSKRMGDTQSYRSLQRRFSILKNPDPVEKRRRN